MLILATISRIFMCFLVLVSSQQLGMSLFLWDPAFCCKPAGCSSGLEGVVFFPVDLVDQY